jgi:hypothetical protein
MAGLIPDLLPAFESAMRSAPKLSDSDKRWIYRQLIAATREELKVEAQATTTMTAESSAETTYRERWRGRMREAIDHMGQQVK